MLLSIPEIHTDLLWDLSVLFGSLCILYFGFIFFFRNRLSARSRNISERRKQLTPIISNFLFYGEDASKEEKYEYVDLKVQIREFVKDPVNRSILKDILLDLQRDLTGEARLRLYSLYKDFDLHLDAISKLNSWRWEIVTKGIVELTQMQVVEAYSSIRKFINHRKSVIRKHAQIATVSLKHEGIGHFLDCTKYPISEWQQIKILEILRNKEDFIPPNFGAWLMSSNKDVVLFTLRLIRYYNQTDSNASVTELLKHKDDEVKQAAIDCIKEFGIVEALPTLMAAFSRAKRDTRILILDAIGNIGNEEHIPFLREVHQKVSNFNVRSKALGAINTISPETILPHENLDPHIQTQSENLIPEEEELTNKQEETVETLDPNPTETIEDEIVVTEEGSELFYEDLDVFDHCFMEELNDILDARSNEEEDVEVKYLPLDFLPLVIEKPTDMDKKKPKKMSSRKLRQLNVHFEEVHPDAEFREELENILSRIEVQDPDGNTEVEYLDFKFLPFVVDQDQEKTGLPALIKEINNMEVNGAEIVLSSPAKDLSPSDCSTQEPNEPPEDENDACALVNWGELQHESGPEVTSYEDESVRQVEERPDRPNLISHSIFEDLFRKSDEDSKLILLDEMVELGDHKEVAFLKTLNKERSVRVRRRVASVTAKLLKKLKKEDGTSPEGNLVRWEVRSDLNGLLPFDMDQRKYKNN